MIPEHIYYSPNTIDEAAELLSKKNKKFKIISGGTDIIPGFHINSSRFKDIAGLIDIKNIPGMKKIFVDGDFIRIGAGVTFSELQKSKIITAWFPLLVNASSTVGSVQIRNRASVAGNFINNAPCADSVPPLLVYNSLIKVKSKKKESTIKLSDFLVKPYHTRLKKDEIVTEILIPKISKKYIGSFYKLGRRRGVAVSRISLAVVLLKKKNVLEDIRIAGGAVTPIGMRFYDIEKMFIGSSIADNTFYKISEILGERVLEVTGLRWSTDYKLPVLQQLTYQMLQKICGNDG